MENPQKLKEFRATILTKLCKFWDDTKDIKIAVTETLSHLARRENLIGWVRPSSQSDLPALADEIARLSKENAQLRSQIIVGTGEDKFNGLTFFELKNILQQLGLLEPLKKDRQKLTRGVFVPGSGLTNQQLELLTRGLVERHDGSLRLSDSGRSFLNKLESYELNLAITSKPGEPPSG